MRISTIVFSLLMLLIVSCTKHENVQYNDAVIAGYDLRLCACCGGLLVSFSKDSIELDKSYQWYQKNGNLGVTEKDTFPLKLKIVHHAVMNTCVASKGEIEITDLIKVK